MVACCVNVRLVSITVTHGRASVPAGLTPATTIYPIATGPPAVLSVQLPFRASMGKDLILLRPKHNIMDETSLTYWSPHDPYRVRTISFLDWRVLVRSGDLFVFRSRNFQSTEYLLWLWGSATAVRTQFGIQIWCGITSCNGAAFIGDSEGGKLTLHVLPLRSERSVTGLPPAALPAPSAPLLQPRRLPLVATVFCKSVLTLPEGSEVHTPLVTCCDHKHASGGVWRITATEPSGLSS